MAVGTGIEPARLLHPTAFKAVSPHEAPYRFGLIHSPFGILMSGVVPFVHSPLGNLIATRGMVNSFEKCGSPAEIRTPIRRFRGDCPSRLNDRGMVPGAGIKPATCGACGDATSISLLYQLSYPGEMVLDTGVEPAPLQILSLLPLPRGLI